MPSLPANAGAAAASSTDEALAFAIEAVRLGQDEQQVSPPVSMRLLFTEALPQLIRKALAPDDGDPSFQALVMQAQDAAVHEHAQLSKQREADQRAIRAATNAIAHPGKLRRMPANEVRDALARLHGLAAASSWEELAGAIENLLGRGFPASQNPQPALQAIRSNPALDRLVRGNRLLHLEAVQRYQALCERQGPMAGTHAALSKGRASARRGEVAEETGVQAFRKIADALNRHAKGAADYRVVQSLRNPPAFPGEANKAKEEWDAAIVRSSSSGDAAELVLLAEIKASPAAATADLSRLLRGLRRLAEASPEATYAFACADGVARIDGASLRRLQPDGDSLPPQVIYCCSAPPEAYPPLLSAASKAMLLGEPASLAFAHRLLAGELPSPASLESVWNALMTEPRLRAALHQYDTARKARAAMLHPADLLASVAQTLDASGG